MSEQSKTPGVENAVQEERNPLEISTLSVGVNLPANAQVQQLQFAIDTFPNVADAADSYRFQFMSDFYVGNPLDSAEATANRYGVEYVDPGLRDLKQQYRELLGPVSKVATQFGSELVNSGGPVSSTQFNHAEGAAFLYEGRESTALSQNASSINFVSAGVTQRVAEQLREKGIEIASSPLVFGHLERVAAGRVVASCIEAGLDPARTETIKHMLEDKPNLNILALAA